MQYSSSESFLVRSWSSPSCRSFRTIYVLAKPNVKVWPNRVTLTYLYWMLMSQITTDHSSPVLSNFRLAFLQSWLKTCDDVTLDFGTKTESISRIFGNVWTIRILWFLHHSWSWLNYITGSFWLVCAKYKMVRWRWCLPKKVITELFSSILQWNWRISSNMFAVSILFPYGYVSRCFLIFHSEVDGTS